MRHFLAIGAVGAIAAACTSAKERVAQGPPAAPAVFVPASMAGLFRSRRLKQNLRLTRLSA